MVFKNIIIRLIGGKKIPWLFTESEENNTNGSTKLLIFSHSPNIAS